MTATSDGGGRHRRTLLLAAIGLCHCLATAVAAPAPVTAQEAGTSSASAAQLAGGTPAHDTVGKGVISPVYRSSTGGTVAQTPNAAKAAHGAGGTPTTGAGVAKAPAPAKAAKHVANPHDFKYVLKPHDVCARSDSLLGLVVVHTAPAHFQRRMFIRRTWGAHALYDKLRIAVVFALGTYAGGDVKYGNNSEAVQMALYRENEAYGDLMQEDFADTYRNLTYKAVMWLKWVTQECPQPRWIIKVDDDVLINSYSLSGHLAHMSKHHYADKNTISCLKWSGVKVIRNKKSKWYVSPEEYAEKWYPPYCSGSAYIFSADLIPRLYAASYQVPFFWVDDFYITGALAKEVGAKFNQMASLYAVTNMPAEERERRLTHAYALFAHVPDLSYARRYDMWRTVDRMMAKHDNLQAALTTMTTPRAAAEDARLAHLRQPNS